MKIGKAHSAWRAALTIFDVAVVRRILQYTCDLWPICVLSRVRELDVVARCV